MENQFSFTIKNGKVSLCHYTKKHTFFIRDIRRLKSQWQSMLDKGVIAPAGWSGPTSVFVVSIFLTDETIALNFSEEDKEHADAFYETLDRNMH